MEATVVENVTWWWNCIFQKKIQYIAYTVSPPEKVSVRIVFVRLHVSQCVCTWVSVLRFKGSRWSWGVSGASGAPGSLMKFSWASGSLREPQGALEGPRGAYHKAGFQNTDKRTGVRKLPVSYRTSSPSRTLPCIHVSTKKRQPGAGNRQQYPLPCCTHFRFPICVQISVSLYVYSRAEGIADHYWPQAVF